MLSLGLIGLKFLIWCTSKSQVNLNSRLFLRSLLKMMTYVYAYFYTISTKNTRGSKKQGPQNTSALNAGSSSSGRPGEKMKESALNIIAIWTCNIFEEWICVEPGNLPFGPTRRHSRGECCAPSLVLNLGEKCASRLPSIEHLMSETCSRVFHDKDWCLKSDKTIAEPLSERMYFWLAGGYLSTYA